MQYLINFYNKTLKYDLYNKFNYQKVEKLPKLKKIILNFGCKTTDIKNLSASLLALELITHKKGTLTTSKKPNILLKIRKGHPVGCKVTLTKQIMFNFLEKLIIQIFPKTKNFEGLKVSRNLKPNMFSYDIHNTFTFTELEEHYHLFNNLQKLNITFVTQTTNKKELLFLLKSLQLPTNK